MSWLAELFLHSVTFSEVFAKSVYLLEFLSRGPHPRCTLESPGSLNKVRHLGATPRESDVIDLGCSPGGKIF